MHHVALKVDYICFVLKRNNRRRFENGVQHEAERVAADHVRRTLGPTTALLYSSVRFGVSAIGFFDVYVQWFPNSMSVSELNAGYTWPS